MREVIAERAINPMPGMQCHEILAEVDIAAQIVRTERLER
jgi:hypothetical protein